MTTTTTENHSWEQWLTAKAEQGEARKRKLRWAYDEASATEEEARVKFCRARDRADTLRYELDKAQAKRDAARKALADATTNQ